jgi:hypothetical protein
MKRRHRYAVGLLLGATTAGCVANGANAPLIFVQTQSLGITAGANAAQAAPELTLGYRNVDVALVPVAIGNQPLLGTLEDKTKATFTDALSVIGQFNANGSGGTTPTGDFGNFFATGQAAKRLGDGFAYKLGQPVPKSAP